MLSREDNETLTRVGPGTLMGDLLRRYWIPACLSSEIDEPDGPPARVWWPSATRAATSA
jgi:phthalate 4,5-dioxygenase